MAALLLEIARQPALDQLLQKMVHRALAAPRVSFAFVVIWLIEKGEECSTGVSSRGGC